MSFNFVAGAFVVLFLARYLWKKRSSIPLPPGPRGIPILGNVYDIPSTRQWETYDIMAKEYGQCCVQFPS